MVPQVGGDVGDGTSTIIWVVRHAEREDNVNKAWRHLFHSVTHLSKDDPPLSKRGQLQTKECATRFEHVHLDHVFSSPYDRCVNTAARIVRDREIPIKVEPGFSEVYLF
uniref:Uncharacterized protein n=1 Tax=Parascaris univalens TaxID=6257 RepID=A0A915AWJ8_PARUN